MKKMLSSVTSLLCLALLVASCGPNVGKLNDKDKDALNKKGDKPLNQITDASDKQEVERVLMTLVTEHIDYEAVLKIVRGARVNKSEEECKKAIAGVTKADGDKVKTALKDNEAKVKTHFSEINVKEFAGCVEKLPEVLKELTNGVCSANSTQAAEALKKKSQVKFGGDEAAQKRCMSQTLKFANFAIGLSEGGASGAKPEGEGKGAAAAEGKPAAGDGK